jgi:anti-anti-sigma factor
MNIQKNVNGNVYEFLVAGRVDGEGANQLEEQILLAIRADAQIIYVNLNAATFLCSAGLRVLIQYWRQMQAMQKSLQATRLSPEADAVLTASGFRELLIEKI